MTPTAREPQSQDAAIVRPSLVGALFLALIAIYQRWISPLTPPSCRYTPTCSSYAKEAISTYGGWRGGWMAWSRIVRCHPFHPGGCDPVPQRPGVAHASDHHCDATRPNDA